MNLDLIKRESIIICPSSKKENILSSLANRLDYNIKFITKEKLISSLTFSYGNEAIVFLMKKGYSFDNALEILNNLKFVKEGSSKLNILFSIKEQLKENKLLKENRIFKHIFKGKDVFIIGYSSLDKELINSLDSLGVNYTFIEEEKENYSHTLYVFENLEDEVKYFFNSVCKLVNSGTSINDILLYSYPPEYDMILRKYAKAYKMPINFSSNMLLKDSPLYKEFISYLDELDFEEALDKLKDKEDEYGVISKVINSLNDIVSLELTKKEKIKFFLESSKQIKLREKPYKNGIEIVTSTYRGDKHVFVLGFSLGSYPKIKKDTDFLLDKEKEICGINTSKIENEILLDELENFLLNNKNIHLSFKQREGKNVFYESLLVEKLNIEKKKYHDDYLRFNHSLAALEVASYRDLKRFYGIDHSLINAMDVNEIRYNGYDHKYTFSEDFQNSNKLVLSYSQIDEYNRCPFQYFIKRICGANEAFENTFNMKLGTLYHDVFEDSLTKEVKKEDYLDKINQEFSSPKEKFFVDLLFDQVFNVIKKNNAFKEISSFKKEYGEHPLSFRIDQNTSLKGFIDKVVINEDDKEIYIVDYKTGDASFTKEFVPIGLSLQLPIYSVLIKNTYPEYSISGIYIQNVLRKEKELDSIYKLDGITINDEEKISHLEHSLDGQSKYISGLSKTAKGIKQTKKLLSQEEFEQIVKETEQVINSTIMKIRNGEFPIRPLYIDKKDQACKYCPLGAICFKDESDHNYVEIEEEE